MTRNASSLQSEAQKAREADWSSPCPPRWGARNVANRDEVRRKVRREAEVSISIPVATLSWSRSSARPLLARQGSSLWLPPNSTQPECGHIASRALGVSTRRPEGPSCTTTYQGCLLRRRSGWSITTEAFLLAKAPCDLMQVVLDIDRRTLPSFRPSTSSGSCGAACEAWSRRRWYLNPVAYGSENNKSRVTVLGQTKRCSRGGGFPTRRRSRWTCRYLQPTLVGGAYGISMKREPTLTRPLIRSVRIGAFAATTIP